MTCAELSKPEVPPPFPSFLIPFCEPVKFSFESKQSPSVQLTPFFCHSLRRGKSCPASGYNEAVGLFTFYYDSHIREDPHKKALTSPPPLYSVYAQPYSCRPHAFAGKGQGQVIQ